MRRFQEIVSRRHNFAGLYATLALTVGLLDVFSALMAGVLHFPGVVASIADGSLFSSGGNTVTVFGLVVLAISISPFFLVYLALVRGQRIGQRYLVVLPILSIVTILIGGRLFAAGAVVLARLIAWVFDGLCIYYGGRRQAGED